MAVKKVKEAVKKVTKKAKKVEEVVETPVSTLKKPRSAADWAARQK